MSCAVRCQTFVATMVKESRKLDVSGGVVSSAGGIMRRLSGSRCNGDGAGCDEVDAVCVLVTYAPLDKLPRSHTISAKVRCVM